MSRGVASSGKSSRRSARAVAPKFPDVTAGTILNRLNDAKALARQQGMELLAGAPEAVAAEALNKLLDLGTHDARMMVLDALRDLPHPLTPSPLREEGEPQTKTLREVWERMASASESDARSEALHVAGRLPAVRALQVLPLWLQDSEASLRRHALSRLLLTGDAKAATHALQSVGDSDASVRLAAVRILERFEHPDAALPLLRLACGEDKACREATMQALLNQAPLFALLAAAELERDAANEEARAVFARFTKPEITSQLRQGLSWAAIMNQALPAESLSRLLRHVPEEVIAELHSTLAAEWLRAAIIAYDGSLDSLPPASLQRLLAACGDPSETLRAQAIAALAAHDSAEPGEILGRLLRHALPDVRRMAAEALGRSGPRGLASLRRALSDKEMDVRRSTYDALALLLPDDEAGIWAAALRDGDARLRAYAVERLIALLEACEALRNGDKSVPATVVSASAIPATLRTALVLAGSDRDAAVRVPAIQVLVMRHVVDPTLGDAYREALAEAIDPEVKAANAPLASALVHAVAALMPPGALGTLIGAARHRSAVIRRAAAEAISAKESAVAAEAFALLADTDDPGLLKRVATALAKARDPRGLVPVIRAQEECRGQSAAMRPLLDVYPKARELAFLLSGLRMQWPSVKRFAARELLKQESPEVIKPLIEASKDEDVEVQLAAVQALGKFVSRPEVYKRLIDILDYGDVAVRQESVAVLGKFQVKDAVDPLIRLLGNPFLRGRAEEALMQIGDRRGFLAIKRRKIREKMFGKKKSKGPIEPPGRKGKVGLGQSKPKKG